MAVYERAYRAYTGPLTPERNRFLIVPRYAFRDVFRSRLFTAFFSLCFLGPVIFAILIYLRHNAGALALLETPVSQVIVIDSNAFLWFLRIQGLMLGFLVAFVVGPALVSPDLRNNALALYLSRPFSRTEYVLGKMSVLVVLVSAITWVPGLVLFGFEAYLEGFAWSRSHLRIPIAIFVGSWVWIVVLSLLALAISATVKWRPLASATLFGVFFVAAGFGTAVSVIFRTPWGGLFDISRMVQTVWSHLFGIPSDFDLPAWAAWGSLAALGATCVLVLARRVRAYEVVR